jgi:hypothetical protein
VPESRSSSRITHGASVPPSSVDSGGEGAGRGELRLQVLNSLPAPHQRYLFEKVRVLCRNFLRNRRSELTPEDLLSEIYQKLLGTVSMDDEAELTPAIATGWSIDPDDPERDGRVVWLIKEIGGSDALNHRHEDILRQRFGRWLPEGGRRTVQRDEDEITEPGSDPDQLGPLQRKDAYRAWRGLVATICQQFPLHDDVSMLVRLMDEVRDILEESSTGRWPIATMVALLNERFSPPPWSGDRVDNAKKRLVNWTKRLMRNNGLDPTGLEDLFARVASRKESGKQASPTPPSQRHRLM